MGDMYQTGGANSFTEMGCKKELSRLLKINGTVYYDFYSYKDELVQLKDHGDTFRNLTKHDYVINVALLLIKGIVRTMAIDQEQISQSKQVR